MMDTPARHDAPLPQDAPDFGRPGWVPPPYPAYPAFPPPGEHTTNAVAWYPAAHTPPPPPVPGYAYDAYARPYAAPPARRTCTDATISLVAGAAAWVFVPFLGAVIAVIFGMRARRQIRAAGGTLDGDGMALVGLILGWAQLALTVALTVLLLLVVAFGLGIFFGSR